MPRFRAFLRWYGRVYHLVSLLFLGFLLAQAAADELKSALERIYAWSAQRGVWMQLFVLLATLHFLAGLIIVATKQISAAIRPDIEEGLRPFLVRPVDWLNRRPGVERFMFRLKSEEKRGEQALLEYRYPLRARPRSERGTSPEQVKVSK